MNALFYEHTQIVIVNYLGAETLRRIPNAAIKKIITQRINHVCSVENFAYNM